MDSKLLILIMALFLCVSIKCGETKCRAIAISGGGTKGAYEAGILKGLVENLPKGETEYDIVSGVSAGALNGALFSVYAKGDEQAAVDFLVEQWKSIERSDMIDDWPLGVVQGFFKKGLFDNAPLIQYVTNLLSQYDGLKRIFLMGVVDANKGTYITFDETVDFKELPIYVAASAAIPAVFPYIIHDGIVMIDGGVMINLDTISPILRCKELVPEEDIILDIIMAHPGEVKEEDLSDAKTLDMLWRYLDLSDHMKDLFVILNTQRAYPNVHFRYIVKPTRFFPGTNQFAPLDFNQAHLRKMIEMGEEDAIEAIKNKKTVDDLIREFALKQYGLEFE